MTGKTFGDTVGGKVTVNERVEVIYGLIVWWNITVRGRNVVGERVELGLLAG